MSLHSALTGVPRTQQHAAPLRPPLGSHIRGACAAAAFVASASKDFTDINARLKYLRCTWRLGAGKRTGARGKLANKGGGRLRGLLQGPTAGLLLAAWDSHRDLFLRASPRQEPPLPLGRFLGAFAKPICRTLQLSYGGGCLLPRRLSRILHLMQSHHSRTPGGSVERVSTRHDCPGGGLQVSDH